MSQHRQHSPLKPKRRNRVLLAVSTALLVTFAACSFVAAFAFSGALSFVAIANGVLFTAIAAMSIKDSHWY